MLHGGCSQHQRRLELRCVKSGVPITHILGSRKKVLILYQRGSLYDGWFYIKCLLIILIKCPQLKPDQRASGPNQWPPNLTRGAIIQPFWPATTRPVWRTSWDSLVSQDKTLKIWDFPSMQRADTSVLRDSACFGRSLFSACLGHGFFPCFMYLFFLVGPHTWANGGLGWAWSSRQFLAPTFARARGVVCFWRCPMIFAFWIVLHIFTHSHQPPYVYHSLHSHEIQPSGGFLQLRLAVPVLSGAEPCSSQCIQWPFLLVRATRRKPPVSELDWGLMTGLTILSLITHSQPTNRNTYSIVFTQIASAI